MTAPIARIKTSHIRAWSEERSFFWNRPFPSQKAPIARMNPIPAAQGAGPKRQVGGSTKRKRKGGRDAQKEPMRTNPKQSKAKAHPARYLVPISSRTACPLGDFRRGFGFWGTFFFNRAPRSRTFSCGEEGDPASNGLVRTTNKNLFHHRDTKGTKNSEKQKCRKPDKFRLCFCLSW